MKGIILFCITLLLISTVKSAPITDQSFTELQTRVYSFFSKDNFIQESYNLTWKITEDMRVGDELISEELVIEVPKESKFATHSKDHTLRSSSTPIFDDEEQEFTNLDFKLDVSEIRGSRFQGVPTGVFSFETNAEDYSVYDKDGIVIYQKSIDGKLFGIRRRSFSLKQAEDFTFRISDEFPEPLIVTFKIDVNFIENNFLKI